MENAIPNYISASTYAKRPLPLSLPLSFSLTLLCCLHTLLPHLAWAVVAAIVAPRPQDERSSRSRLPRFRSRRCQQDDLSCSRFYLFVFIIQQNQLRLHPVTALPPFPLSIAGMAAAVPQRKTGWLLLSPWWTCHNLHAPLRLACCWLWLRCRRDVYIYGSLFPYVLLLSTPNWRRVLVLRRAQSCSSAFSLFAPSRFIGASTNAAQWAVSEGNSRCLLKCHISWKLFSW